MHSKLFKSKFFKLDDEIDNLIQKCQMESILPYKIIEWIPYNNLQNIKYLTKGGCSEIYTADWIDGYSSKNLLCDYFALNYC